jgi:hypothetical protein
MSNSFEYACCQVEVSETGRSLVQKNPTKYGVSECDRVASTARRPCSTGGYCVIGKNRRTVIFPALLNGHETCSLTLGKNMG